VNSTHKKNYIRDIIDFFMTLNSIFFGNHYQA